MLPLHRAREAADAAGLPIMVHPQDAWCDSIDDILKVMKGGDILTHCFHDFPCGILNGEGRVRDSVLDAIERGVVFDVGHGAGSFSWGIVEAAMSQDVLPNTISSDLHIYNVNGPCLRSCICGDKVFAPGSVDGRGDLARDFCAFRDHRDEGRGGDAGARGVWGCCRV